MTLVGQGLTLAPLIRWLGVQADGAEAEEEEVDARTKAIGVAQARLDQLANEGWTHDGAVDYLRGYYAKRAHIVGARFGRLDHDHDGVYGKPHTHGDGLDHAEEHRQMLAGLQRLQLELLRAEREAILKLRDTGTIGDEVLHRIERDLDFEELRIQG